MIIKKILNLFKIESNEKTKKLKEIDKLIADCTNYKELVALTNLYNKIKNEDKTN
jgi:flagellar biosynthesis regulator FlbT